MLALCLFTQTGKSVLPVVDYSHIAQDAWHEVVNIAKWAKTETDTAATELHTLGSYENSIVQLARMGNPAALRNLPGVSTVGELMQMYGEVRQDYFQLQLLTNPQQYQSQFNSILSTYSQPQWNGFQTMGGQNILPNMGSFQFPVADYNVAQTVQQQISQLEQKRQTLTQQRDSTLQSLQSASDQSAVQKYHGVLDGINSAIADVNQSIGQLFQRAKLQQSQNAAAQQVYQASQAEQRAAAAYQGIDNDLSGLPANNFRESPLWGNN